jgi:hypothetical protein
VVLVVLELGSPVPVAPVVVVIKARPAPIPVCRVEAQQPSRVDPQELPTALVAHHQMPQLAKVVPVAAAVVVVLAQLATLAAEVMVASTEVAEAAVVAAVPPLDQVAPAAMATRSLNGIKPVLHLTL